MTHAVYRRGQPVMALAIVLTVWVAVRAMMWESTPEAGPGFPSIIAARARIDPLAEPGSQDGAIGPQTALSPELSLPRKDSYWSPSLPVGQGRSRERAGLASDDRLLWQGETGLRDGPEIAAAAYPPSVPYVSPDVKSGPRRWSADGWMLLRDGGASSPITGPARATYGASQLGAAVRYRIAPESGHRPTVYLRGTAALVQPRDKEVATGLSARPVSGLPLTLAAELRAGQINNTMRVRPAVMAVTELLPQQLPLDFLGEAYVQAGYVGGTGATAFVDGQIRVDTPVTRMGRTELRVGGGAWGGAQMYASRVDLGPAVSLGVSVNDIIFARVTADWRFRVAGNAAPDSGPALTLSAGF